MAGGGVTMCSLPSRFLQVGMMNIGLGSDHLQRFARDSRYCRCYMTAALNLT